MVSYKPTLPNSQEEQDRAYNPGEQAYREGMGAGYVNSGTDQAEAFANDPANASDDLRNKEAAGDTPEGGFYRPSTQNKKNKINLKGFFKKGGPLIGAGGTLGILGIILTGIFAPASMLVNMMENLGITNDSSSTSMQRRFMGVFSNATNDGGNFICSNTSKNIKCKMGRISNTALRQLEKKGIVAIYDDGVTNTHTDTRRGYPSKNPSNYRIDVGGGNDPVTVSAQQLPTFLAENPQHASKILGTRGAFNFKVKAWAGKHISNKIYKPFGVVRNGGLADGQNTPEGNSNRARFMLEKLRGKLPDLGGLSSSVGETQLREKVTGDINRAKKGGVGYLIAVGSCIGVRAPGYIAAAVAAVQLAQVISIAHDTILSPASKLKASAVDDPSRAITQEDVGAIGDLMTDRFPQEDGAMKSALDSTILLAALGVNKGKPAVSAKYTPGYSVLTNGAVRVSQDAADVSKEACNAVMSPAAMYAAFAVNAAVTVAAASTVFVGIAKVGVDIVVGEAISLAAGQVVGAIGPQVIEDLATNNAVQTAQGSELGDVIGISALSFYSAGGQARSLPVLKESQLADYAQVQAEVWDQERAMDVASLSPFDISSRYTFLGSIVNNARLSYMASGSSLTAGSILSSIGSMITASSTTNAASQTINQCSYAREFQLNTDDPANTPAINAAGLPCTGITDEQASMSTNEAIDLLANEGWINLNANIADNATIAELLEADNETGLSLDGNAFIKLGTPLHDFITTCSDASTGDYLTNAAGCTTEGTVRSPGEICSAAAIDCTNEDGESYDIANPEGGVENARALVAMSVFLLDFQILQSMNGDDVEVLPTTDEEEVEVEESAVIEGRSHNFVASVTDLFTQNFQPTNLARMTLWNA